MKMKRATILVILLILATVPAAVAEEHTIVWAHQFSAECPAGNRFFQYISGYRSFTDRTFDNATIDHFNLTIKTTEPADIRVHLVQYGYGHNISYQQITSRVLDSEGIVMFNASDFEIDEWVGFPEKSTWTGYYNLTHYYQTIRYYVRLPYFLIEFFNTGTDQAMVTWEYGYNLTLHGYRDSEDDTYFPKSHDWTILPPDDIENRTTPIYHWWGDYFPGTSNILVDGLFYLWFNDQDFNNTEWFAFYYDPTQFYPVIAEKAFILGIVIGGLAVFALVSFGKRFIG